MEKKGVTFFLHNKKHQENTNKVASTSKHKSETNSKEGRRNDFDNNRPGLKSIKENGEKKPFDKKAYRLKKYSKKYKLEQFEEKRKKKMLYDYHKSIKNDPMVGSYKPKPFDEDKIDSNEPEVGRYVKHPDLLEKEKQEKTVTKTKRDPFQKAKEHYERIKQEKIQKKLEAEKSKEERAQKIGENKKKKQERYKKLSKKTKRGQPVMSGRMELLLEKIQS